MVQIIPAAQPKRSFANKLSEGLERGLSRGQQLMSRYNENEALMKRGIDLRDIEDPESRAQLLSHDLQYSKKNKMADLSHKNEASPGFGTNRNRAPGIPELDGNPRKIMSFDEQWDEANRIAQYRTENGVPTSTEDVLPLVHSRNEENKVFADTQEKFGNQAVEALSRNVGPELLNPNLQAKFRKFGEEEAEKSVSQSEFHKNLAERVKNFKDAIVNIQEGIQAPRLFTNLKRAVLGKSKTEEQEDLRIKTLLKPLLDDGESEIARTLLSEKGFGPEEIESKITDLPETAKNTIANMPEIKKQLKPTKKQNIYEKRYSPFQAGKEEYEYPQEQQQVASESMNKIFQDDPSVNLILLRKAFQDKGADWRLFQSTLDRGILEGKIKLNPAQKNQLVYTGEPPLDGLDKIVHGLNLIGK